MNNKVPLQGEKWDAHIERAVSLIHSRDSFLFSAYLDPDALGSMLSLAIYLRLMGKKVFLVIPEIPNPNLDFLDKIIAYNSLDVLSGPEEISRIKHQIQAVIFCDTANTHLVPFFTTLQEHFMSKNLDVLEIDHHFGNDSMEISEHSVQLFRKANANTEIVGELLLKLIEKSPEQPHPLHQRNILLALITGLLSDTIGGKIVYVPEDYDYWMDILEKQLVKTTRWRASPGRPADSRKDKFGSAEQINEYLNHVPENQKLAVSAFSKNIVLDEEIAFLNLLNHHQKAVPADPTKDPAELTPEVCRLLLMIVPERSRKLGVFCYHDKDIEGKDCIFVKIRQSTDFNGTDLREVESEIRKAFPGNLYLGGGGHPGAVSFRIQNQDEDTFLSSLAPVKDFLKKSVR